MGKTLAGAAAIVAGVFLALPLAASAAAADAAGAEAGAEPASGPGHIYPAHAEPVHRPVLHNRLIHVYEVHLKPGQITYYHRHTQDQLGITLGNSTTANQILGKPETVADSGAGGMSYVPHSTWGGTVHRVRSVSGEFHVIGIEFAKPAPAGTRVLMAGPEQTTLDVPQGSLSRTTIAPGETRVLTGTLLVATAPGRLRLGGRTWAFRTGSVRWLGPDVAVRAVNPGTQPVPVLVLALKP